MDASLRALTGINLDDLVASFGWTDHPWPAAVLRAVFHAPAEKFARQMLTFDAAVGAEGLSTAADRLLAHFAHKLTVFGRENLPTSGPLLFLSNHPGMVDTLALFCAIQRPDLRIIAVERPFLKSLTHTSEQLIFVNADPSRRMAAVRAASAHLKAGGAALTFPAGQIEPDPAVYPGAREALGGWSESAGVLARFAPETQIVPTLVSGVLWDKAVKHPLTKLKPTRDERERLGAALQLLAHIQLNARPLQVTIQFAAPLTLAEVGSADSAAIHAKILARMQGLLDSNVGRRSSFDAPKSGDFGVQP